MFLAGMCPRRFGSGQGEDLGDRSFLRHADETGQMGQPHLSHLPPSGSSECPAQSGSASETFPLPGTKAPGAHAGQEHCMDS